jgi:NADH:ubiquinone reductase (H+-translocating)
VKSANDGPRVLVVGAGFAGLATVSRLARGGMRVTLADRHIYSTFQPLLYQVATAGLAPSDVAYPLRGFAHKYGARFRHGDLAHVDPDGRIAEFADGGHLEYDYLILATGVTAGFFGITGAAEYSHALYTLHDAATMRARILAGLERLSLEGVRKDVTVTIVGGGATGVELAGTLAEFRNIGLPSSYPDIDPQCVHIRLIEQAPVLLTPYVPPLQEYAREQLVKRGVDLRLNATIKEITADRLILADGEELPSDLTAWAAGVAGPPEAGKWGLPQGKGGRLLARPDLRVEGQDRIFAIGDIAVTGDHPVPQLAQPALQMGRHAAAQIRRLEAGHDTVPFRYHDKGTMATIGSRSAVVELNHGIRFRGTIAWLAWLALHLVTLLGGRNRINALINLSSRYLSWRRGGGIIVGDDPPAQNAEGN